LFLLVMLLSCCISRWACWRCVGSDLAVHAAAASASACLCAVAMLRWFLAHHLSRTSETFYRCDLHINSNCVGHASHDDRVLLHSRSEQ
jgi:hypothetical protein